MRPANGNLPALSNSEAWPITVAITAVMPWLGKLGVPDLPRVCGAAEFRKALQTADAISLDRL